MNTIGIDVGGTNIRVAIVNEAGQIQQLIKGQTDIHLGSQHVMQKLKDMIKSLDGYEQCIGIGLAVPGSVDTKLRVMLLASNLPGFAYYPIAEELETEFHIPVYMDNDANAAGLGEALQGAAKGSSSCYYVTISTGIGGAFVLDGKVVSGKHGHAGEIGNLIIDRYRKKVSALNAGAVECEASGTALTRKGKEYFESVEHAGDVFDLARKGNKEAVRLCDEMAYDIAVMFSMIAHICDPDIFVIGGGVMKGKDVFFEKMIAYFHTMVHKGMKNVEFKEAVLIEPGIIGAAMMPLSNNSNRR